MGWTPRVTDKRLREAIGGVLDSFKDPDSLDHIPRTYIKLPPDAPPCWGYSMTNQLLIKLARTEDARGPRQWEAMGRTIKKGAKPFEITAPLMGVGTKKVKDKNGNEVTERYEFLKGFKGISVYRYEDTEGKPLPVINFKPPEPPPLLEVAQYWGLNVKWAAKLSDYYGYFAEDKKEIVLQSHDWQVFFHELSHAAHAKFRKLNGGQHPEQEIVAEFSAAILCRLYGVSEGDGIAYQYIERYAAEIKQDVVESCMKVMSEVDKVLCCIFGVDRRAHRKEAKNGRN